jgi:hypothetical protein
VNPQLADVAECVVTVTPFGDLRAQMNPVTVRGRLSRFVRISVENRGNAPLSVDLVVLADEDVLRFDKGGLDALFVPAGQVGRPLLRVRSVRRRLLARQERYPFAVTVSPTDEQAAAGALPVELRGTYIQRSLLPKWVALLLILLLLLALLYYLLPLLQNRILLLPPPPVAATAPPLAAGQQAPPPDQGRGDQKNQDKLTVTIRHGNVALASIVNPRGDGGPAPVVQQASGRDRSQIWYLLRLEDGSWAVVPATASDYVLQQPNPNDTSQMGLSRVGTGGQLSEDQTWELRSVGGSQFAIVNSATGDCMTDAGNGRAVQGMTCTNDRAQDQVWQLTGS